MLGNNFQQGDTVTALSYTSMGYKIAGLKVITVASEIRSTDTHCLSLKMENYFPTQQSTKVLSAAGSSLFGGGSHSLFDLNRYILAEGSTADLYYKF